MTPSTCHIIMMNTSIANLLELLSSAPFYRPSHITYIGQVEAGTKCTGWINLQYTSLSCTRSDLSFLFRTIYVLMLQLEPIKCIMSNFNSRLLILNCVPDSTTDVVHASKNPLVLKVHTEHFLALFSSRSIFFSPCLLIYVPRSHTHACNASGGVL